MFKQKIIFRSLLGIFIFALIKWNLASHIVLEGHKLNALVEISDIAVIFTGAFFVFSLVLAGTLTDFKESEKIPGEIACQLEAIQDWILLGLSAPRVNHPDAIKTPIDEMAVKQTLHNLALHIKNWIIGTHKDSILIFPELRKLNELAYLFAKHGSDKEAVKGIQENTNALRKQITRLYSISRNDFLLPAYTLLNFMLMIVLLMLMITRFKSPEADYLVSCSLSFIFLYLYQLIRALDDPFNPDATATSVDLKPLNRLIIRMEEGFVKSGC